jgi:hypothetical protein
MLNWQRLRAPDWASKAHFARHQEEGFQRDQFVFSGEFIGAFESGDARNHVQNAKGPHYWGHVVGPTILTSNPTEERTEIKRRVAEARNEERIETERRLAAELERRMAAEIERRVAERRLEAE